MTADIIIVGCGGHGRETLGIIQAINRAEAGDPPWRILGFVDDAPSELNLKRVQRLAAPYLGTTGWLRDQPNTTHVILAVGDPCARRAVDERVGGYGLPGATLVHPSAEVGPDTVAGEGLLVFAGARVTTNVTLGRHVHLNQNITIGHDCSLADFVSVNPLAAVSGDCVLDEGVMVGTNATVLQGLRVGRDATVGAGACVVRDVPAATVVKGVPAR
ncbi:acetyltransferase [Micromonospora echinofusca]|uniref:acetyltransferase n=1 Tax=Micromonospora echinofusca TaxID=47858 RepID=UPI0033DAD2D1